MVFVLMGYIGLLGCVCGVAQPMSINMYPGVSLIQGAHFTHSNRLGLGEIVEAP
jgi:hypothetical protein